MRLKTCLTMTLLFWLSALFSLSVASNTPSPAPDPAKKCVMCHKKDPAKMLGQHAQALNPHDNTRINCTNCHQAIDPEAKAHPQNRSNITQYRPLYPALSEITEATDDNLAALKEQTNATQTPVAVKQNELCMNCHTPETLRESFWPHDVHAATLSCNDCHKLHPTTDPVMGRDEPEKVELCLGCHAAQSVKQEEQP